MLQNTISVPLMHGWKRKVHCYIKCDRKTYKKYRNVFQVLNSSHSNSKTATEKLSTKSLLGLPPIQATFPFSDVVKCVDIHSIFRIVRMHRFSPGISRMLKKCLSNLLEDPNKTSFSIRTKGRNPEMSFCTI